MRTLFATLVIVFIGFSTDFFASVSDAQEPIQSLTIDQAVNIALRENRDLRAARIQVEEARGRLTQAGVFPNPALESDFIFDSIFANEGERAFSAGISQPLPLSGRIGAQKRVARVDIKRTFADLADLERGLVRDVRRVFTELLAINEQIKLQDTLISLNNELVGAIKAGIKEGLASEKDLNAVAKALRFEDITAGVFYENDRGVFDIAQDEIIDADNLIGFKLTIPLPFFDRKQGLIAETRAREGRAKESVEALKLEIGQEVNDALNRVTTLSALLETYQSGILKTAEDNVKLVEGGYKQGLVGIAEVIQSRQQVATPKSSYINTVRDYQLALNDLQIATGTYPSTISFNKTNEGENK